MKKRIYSGGACLCAALMIISTTAGSVLEANKNVVDGFLGTKSSKVVATEQEELFTKYIADYDNTDALVAKHEEMGERLEEEGAVLLKNNGALPFSSDKKQVTLLGLRSNEKTLYGASIGVSVPAKQNVTLTTALEERGYKVNEKMNEIYKQLAEDDRFGGKGINGLSPSFSGVKKGEEPQYTIAEPSIQDIAAVDPNYMDCIKAYADAAIVVVGRPTSEAADFYPGEAGVNKESGAKNALSLSTNELALIDFAKENFDSVIVLVDSSNPMEIDALKKDEGVDAILWIGLPGNYGFRGIADLLSGDTNPSGALPDIYAVDSTSSPAMANYGVMEYSNALDYLSEEDRGEFYLVEAEGIYTGYRYYETRYADIILQQGNADSKVGTFASSGNWNYQEEVSYPFGYGLSYTTFEQTLKDVDVSLGDKKVSAKIEVKNTGSVDGKAIVQLYGQAPYIPGGVEKSAVQLLEYDKTDVIKAGESVTVEVTADLENLASYDEQNAKTYIFDAGDYYFSIGNGSHEAINNILASQGYTQADGMDADGVAENAYKWNYQTNNGVDATTFAVSATGTPIENRMEQADMNYWQEGTVTYLSRSDWEGTWPKTYDDIAITEKMVPYLTNDFYEIATGDDTSDIVFGEKGEGLTFSDMQGLEYDDPMWDSLLNQLDLQEAINFITAGNRNYLSMESVGFVGGQYSENGPNGFNIALCTYSNPESPWYVSEKDNNAEYSTNDMGCAPLVAATFNKEFIYEYGLLWGNDSLFNNVPIIWGPGLNLHRTPYNGRNGEYYSEDPVLAGNTGLSMVLGGLEKGLIMAPKHFAFNDQESNRNGVAPYMTEQKMRELELRSFEIAVKGGTLGLMTSFSRIGTTYVGAEKALITDILYNEWGFHGYVVSDMVNPATYMTWKESVIAGTTNFDTTEIAESWNSYITATTNTFANDATMLQAIKDRVHNTLYVFAKSNLMNSIGATSKQVQVNTWWRILYKSLFAINAVLTLLCMAGYVVASVKERKEGENR